MTISANGGLGLLLQMVVEPYTWRCVNEKAPKGGGHEWVCLQERWRFGSLTSIGEKNGCPQGR